MVPGGASSIASTLKVQDVAAARFAPARLISNDPADTVMAPPSQAPVKPLGGNVYAPGSIQAIQRPRSTEFANLGEPQSFCQPVLNGLPLFATTGPALPV